MITRNDMNKYWRDFLKNILNIPQAVKFQQNAPLPNDDLFATVRIRGSQDIGWNSIINDTDEPEDINEIVIGERYYFAEINFYKLSNANTGVSAFDFADQIKYAVQHTKGYEFLRALNVAYTDQTEVLDLTALESGNFEERAQLTIRFNLVQAVQETVTEIESVDFSGTFEDCGTDYTIENTIDLTEAL